MKNRADDNSIGAVFIEDHERETTNNRSAISFIDLLIEIRERLNSADAVFYLREKSVAQSNSTFFIPATNFCEVFDGLGKDEEFLCHRFRSCSIASSQGIARSGFLLCSARRWSSSRHCQSGIGSCWPESQI
jgi:hypothetical protein